MRGGKKLDLPLSNKVQCSCVKDRSKLTRCNCPSAQGVIGYPCNLCRGRGVIINCTTCNGTGVIIKPLSLSLDLVSGQDYYTVATSDQIGPLPAGNGPTGPTNPTVNSILVRLLPQDETKKFVYQPAADSSNNGNVTGKLHAVDYPLDVQLALKSGVHQLTLPDETTIKVFIPTVNSLIKIC